MVSSVPVNSWQLHNISFPFKLPKSDRLSFSLHSDVELEMPIPSCIELLSEKRLFLFSQQQENRVASIVSTSKAKLYTCH